MRRPMTPWLKQYEIQLQQIMKERLAQKPDFYEGPCTNMAEWKVKREKLKTKPITPYIEEYGEKLRSQAAEMKALREERKAELRPGPREVWDQKGRQRDLESMLIAS